MTTATLNAYAERQYELGAGDLSAGEYGVAAERLAYAVQLKPTHTLAAALLATAEEALRVTATPTSTPTPSPTLTPSITPSPEATLPPDPAAYLQKAQEAVRVQQWEAAIDNLDIVIALDPQYQRAAVNDLLYTALTSLGRQYLNEGRMEEGILLVDRAGTIKALDGATVAARNLAVQYMTAMRYWGVDWDRTIENLEALYAQMPGYYDVRTRLKEAHIEIARTSLAKTDYCPAVRHLEAALQIETDAEAQNKLAEARTGCASATATPVPAQYGGDVADGVSLPGYPGGRMAWAAEKNYIYNLLYFTGSSIALWDTGGRQPNWRRDGGGLTYKSASGAIIANAPDGTAVTVIETEANFPTYSPDGSRIAYAQRDEAGESRIYVKPVTGGEAVRVGTGRAPIWGPTGFIAYNGCDSGGTCGVMVDNPDDGPNPQRLTSGNNDFPHAWSPDGSEIAYISSASGNWDVWKVNMGGGTVQLTSYAANDGAPGWSPDGGTIAFMSNRDGWGIYLMNADGTNQRRIMELSDNNPEWINERIAWGP